jgi:hypothetical protein
MAQTAQSYARKTAQKQHRNSTKLDEVGYKKSKKNQEKSR